MLHLAKTEEGGTAVCLVTDGSAAPDRALFCITATPDGIHVSDYRAKLDEISKYLYERETISGEEFMDILNRKPQLPA